MLVTACTSTFCFTSTEARWLIRERGSHTAAGVVTLKVGESMQRIVQELCESRGGRPGLSVLTSLLFSVDVKIC